MTLLGCLRASAACAALFMLPVGGALLRAVGSAVSEAGIPQQALTGDPYAYIKFSAGEQVEAKGKDGSWVPCVILGHDPDNMRYHVRVLDGGVGHTLPSVPSQILRRMLSFGERDFRVDNSWLNHTGPGIKYRFQKQLSARMPDYAPWGALISGTDEGDGWVRVGQLDAQYLPFVIDGRSVLMRAGRDTIPPPPREAAPALAQKPELVEKYAVGEHVEFRSKAGEWHPARIAHAGSYPDTYDIVVTPFEYVDFPVKTVPMQNLRKVTTTRAPQQAEPPACKKEGCLQMKVKTQHGREFLLYAGKSYKIENLMRMVCNRLKREWATCQPRVRFMHEGMELSPSMDIGQSGLQNEDVIDMEDLGNLPLAASAPGAGEA